MVRLNKHIRDCQNIKGYCEPGHPSCSFWLISCGFPLSVPSWRFPVGASRSRGSPVQLTGTAAKAVVNVVVKTAIVPPIAAIIVITRKTRFIYFTLILFYKCFIIMILSE
jgi:hypothetical protein